MNPPHEVLDLSVVFTKPSPDSLPGILAHVALQCETLGLSHTGEVFTDPLTQVERDDLFWYLEEYWKWPYLEFAKRGKRVEALLGEVGRRLHDALFQSKEAQTIVQAWQQRENVRHQISMVSDIARILRLPWELLADPQEFFVLRADHPISIVRRIPKEEQATLTTPIQLPLRILLVTARPEGEGFVDPRSISRELVDELQKQSEAGTIELEFLRPPTFAALRDRLKNTDRPIHVLHFDGHGGLDEETKQGILLFETKAGKPSSVKARHLAQLLSNSGVRLAVLTACQSAINIEEDVFSSVSTQLIGNGIDAVIAMSSSILVTSAALYVEAFYHALAEDLPVSIAQKQARQALQSDPDRHLLRRHQDEEAVPVTLADWWVPHFYQQRPLTLHAMPVPHKHTRQQMSAPTRFDDAMPLERRSRFSGRARELLQIERHLLQQRLVIISGFGGIGKTTLACEAADWLTRTRMYTSTCFVSFEHGGDSSMLLKALATLLGVKDDSLTNSDAALARLKPALADRPTILIADNLESLLPGGEAPLDHEGRAQLWQMLRNLARLGAGVLLTSRDPLVSETLLSVNAQIVHLPLRGLHPDDAYALAAQRLENLGIPRTRAPYADLRDLLQQLDHHPLAIQLVLPTLQEHSLAQIRSDFAKLLLSFTDDTVTGRNRSLRASLDYSLRRLTTEQHALLSCLAVFEGGALENSLLAITQIEATKWAQLRQALEEAALLTSEPIRGYKFPFLHFHPIFTPFLRNQSEMTDPTLQERFTRRYIVMMDLLFDRDIPSPQVMRALLSRELPNLRRALAFLLKMDDREAAIDFASRLAHFLTQLGRWRECGALLQQMEAGSATLPTAADPSTLSREEYRYAISAGDAEESRGNYSASTILFTHLLARIEMQPVGMCQGRCNDGSSHNLRNSACL